MSASRFFSQNDRFLNKRDPFPEEEAARFLFSCQEVRISFGWDSLSFPWTGETLMRLAPLSFDQTESPEESV